MNAEMQRYKSWDAVLLKALMTDTFIWFDGYLLDVICTYCKDKAMHKTINKEVFLSFFFLQSPRPYLFYQFFLI